MYNNYCELIDYLLDEFDVSDPTIDLPHSIWIDMVDIHKRLLTAIPKNRRDYWKEKVDDFYKNHFRNTKPR